MNSKNPIQTEKTKEYLRRFPNTSKWSLAAKMFKENTLVYKDVDSARQSIRYYTGSMGDKKRKELSDKSFLNNPHNPFNLPESDEQEWLPYVLPKAANNILMLYDVHIPYHNMKALTTALKYGKDNKVNTIFLAGDFMDCYQISFFEKDPSKRRLSEEFQMVRDFLSSLKKNFPKCKIYMLQGNHEMRYQRLLRLKAPEILDMEEFRFDVILKLREHGIEWIDDMRIVKAGKLNILHGHEFQKGVMSPVNVARGVFLKAKVSTIVGHSHQTSEHTERDLNGDIVTCWSVGTLSELHPEYARINKWNHGFAHVMVNNDGSFNVKNIRIIKGKIV
jgi:predicted phosphodiesterase